MSSFEIVALEVVVLEVVVLEVVALEVVASEVIVLEVVVFEVVVLEEASFASRAVISLASFEDEQTFESLKDLILRVNEHVDSRDYAVVLARIKKFKLDVTRKA